MYLLSRGRDPGPTGDGWSAHADEAQDGGDVSPPEPESSPLKLPISTIVVAEEETDHFDLVSHDEPVGVPLPDEMVEPQVIDIDGADAALGAAMAASKVRMTVRELQPVDLDEMMVHAKPLGRQPAPDPGEVAAVTEALRAEPQDRRRVSPGMVFGGLLVAGVVIGAAAPGLFSSSDEPGEAAIAAVVPDPDPVAQEAARPEGVEVAQTPMLTDDIPGQKPLIPVAAAPEPETNKEPTVTATVVELEVVPDDLALAGTGPITEVSRPRPRSTSNDAVAARRTGPSRVEAPNVDSAAFTIPDRPTGTVARVERDAVAAPAQPAVAMADTFTAPAGGTSGDQPAPRPLATMLAAPTEPAAPLAPVAGSGPERLTLAARLDTPLSVAPEPGTEIGIALPERLTADLPAPALQPDRPVQVDRDPADTLQIVGLETVASVRRLVTPVIEAPRNSGPARPQASSPVLASARSIVPDVPTGIAPPQVVPSRPGVGIASRPVRVASPAQALDPAPDLSAPTLPTATTAPEVAVARSKPALTAEAGFANGETAPVLQTALVTGFGAAPSFDAESPALGADVELAALSTRAVPEASRPAVAPTEDARPDTVGTASPARPDVAPAAAAAQPVEEVAAPETVPDIQVAALSRPETVAVELERAEVPTDGQFLIFLDDAAFSLEPATNSQPTPFDTAAVPGLASADWVPRLPFDLVADGPRVVIGDPRRGAPDWATAGTAILGVQGALIADKAALTDALAAILSEDRTARHPIEFLIRSASGAETPASAEARSVFRTELVDGAVFETRRVRGRWKTFVAAIGPSNGTGLEVGDLLVVETGSRWQLGKPKAMVELMRRLGADRTETATFSIIRNGVLEEVTHDLVALWP